MANGSSLRRRLLSWKLFRDRCCPFRFLKAPPPLPRHPQFKFLSNTKKSQKCLPVNGCFANVALPNPVHSNSNSWFADSKRMKTPLPFNRQNRGLSPLRIATAVTLMLAAVALAIVPSVDTRVTTGSPTTSFSQNKQNEPAIAVDPNHPTVVVAGANDQIDLEACNAGKDTDCPFTAGVGTSGVYFSFDSGQHWTQPIYTGWTARDCLGMVGPDPGCTPHVGSIGTVPNYYEAGLVSQGDPA